MITVNQPLAKYPDFKFAKGDRIVTGDNSIVVINRPDRMGHMGHAKVHSLAFRKNKVLGQKYTIQINGQNWWKPDLLDIEREVHEHLLKKQHKTNAKYVG